MKIVGLTAHGHNGAASSDTACARHCARNRKITLRSEAGSSNINSVQQESSSAFHPQQSSSLVRSPVPAHMHVPISSRPTLCVGGQPRRTDRSVAGRVVPGIKDTACSGDSGGARSTRPISMSCALRRVCEAGSTPAFLRTVAFEMRER